jgi:hypothetical protein
MRDISWLYEQLGRVQAENIVLKEELAKYQQAQNAKVIATADAPKTELAQS